MLGRRIRGFRTPETDSAAVSVAIETLARRAAPVMMGSARRADDGRVLCQAGGMRPDARPIAEVDFLESSVQVKIIDYQ
jgi:hypothetical protein